ncbi:DUF2867 domain-containing protein [Desulfocurvus vexinensis]|uniref:DUF2867 domain-containing protein n=1 Tax=Desulfocurvus vexinensis TaxID=399548 RepID=UPI00048FED52|nr:DUF2867 domain-containing protein [Desulfocurvus vexinensis]
MDGIHSHRELDIYFQGMDHTDTKHVDSDRSLREFLAGMLGYAPPWLRVLYRVRRLLATALGLERHGGAGPALAPRELPFTPGGHVSFFVVRAAREDAYWVAQAPRDRHLEAWVGVVAEALGPGRNRFHVFTSVRHLHWTGPVYFTLIRPFHHLVVAAMMRAGAKG